MRLHNVREATNPRRVTIYLAEKGIDIERVDVDVAADEHKSPRFIAMNPAGQVPVLELDDGEFLSESAVIVEYLEERFPDPPMMGSTPEARARTRVMERIVNDLIVRAGLMLQHSDPYFASRYDQTPAVADALRPAVVKGLDLLEYYLGEGPYLGDVSPSVADCALFALFQTCRVRMKVAFGGDHAGLDAWYARFAARPSAAY